MKRKNNNTLDYSIPISKEEASFWKRTLAFLFDIMIINIIIAWPFQSIFMKYALTDISIDSIIPAKLYLTIIIIFLLALLYFTFLEYYIEQTPGQIMMNIKSISIDGKMTFWKALFRNIFILPFFPFYILWIIEPLYLAFYNQRLLEKWTGTKTINIHHNIKYNLKKVE